MSWKKIDGRIVTIDELRPIIAATKFDAWRPSGGVLHNTGSPNLKRSLDYSHEHWRDMWASFYQGLGWSGGPHFFCFPDKKVLLFTPITTQGVHSPSWNGTKFGLEMVADFGPEDDDAGLGLAVKQTAVAVFGLMYAKLGLDPAGIKLHKEDPRTTHDCPGKDISKQEFIELVEQFMGEAGEHPSGPPPTEAPTVQAKRGTVNTDGLNVRDKSSASGKVIVSLKKGYALSILGEAMNGQTKWLRVSLVDVPVSGWVAARYVDSK